MQAVILAAGRGNRLRPITDEKPKCLVEVNGTPLLINALEALTKRPEIKEVVIVIGYKAELIEQKIGRRYNETDVTYVTNKDWNTTNNIYSLWLAMDKIKEDFFLLEGDIFFEHSILDFAFRMRDKNIVFLSKYRSSMSGTVVEIGERGSKIASGTLVEAEGRGTAIKRLISGSEQGLDFDYSDKFKTVNIYYFNYDFFEKYFRPNLDLYIKTHGSGSFYELILGLLIYLNTPNIYGCVVDNKKWYEIDTENDLDMADYLFSKGEKADKLANLYGGYWRFDFLDFCFLFNLYFPPQHLYSKLGYELPLLINNYPSAQGRIASLLSQWYAEEGFDKENILVGNGASEFIRIFNRNFVKTVTIPVPTFNEYEDLDPSQVNLVQLQEDNGFSLNVDDFISSVIESNSNFAVLLNPNNPTSTVTEREDIVKILESLKHLDGIVVDESFIDFTGDRGRYSVQPLITRYSNLIVLRSLSKEFGIPGLRLGYILSSNEEFKKKVRLYLPIWNINSIAERFIELFPRYQKEYEQSIRRIMDDRENFYRQLSDTEILEPTDGKANFIFCKVVGDNINSTKLRNILFTAHNILIKDCSNKTSLGNKFVRIAVRRQEENNLLIKALKQVKHDIGR